MKRRASTLLAVVLVGLTGKPLVAQTNPAVMVGYGSVNYRAHMNDEFTNNFSAVLAPLFLYSVGPNLLFEAELEFELEGAETATGLEYAQIDYLGWDNFQLVAGKFLLPFGVFGERLHPSWINKLPSPPVVYGHAEGGVTESGLIPASADAGVMLRTSRPFGSGWSFDVSGFVTQGPRAVEPEDSWGSPAPPVSFGTAFSDNNSNKMLGARVGVVKGPTFEMYASGLFARYDTASALGYSAAALSVEYRRRGYELRGEGILTRQEFEEGTRIETINGTGFYVQASKRKKALELVVRWGHLAEGTVNGVMAVEGHDEFAIGVVRWLQPSVPVKFAWEFHEGGDPRLVVQWGFGF